MIHDFEGMNNDPGKIRFGFPILARISDSFSTRVQGNAGLLMEPR